MRRGVVGAINYSEEVGFSGLTRGITNWHSCHQVGIELYVQSHLYIHICKVKCVNCNVIFAERILHPKLLNKRNS